MEVSCNCCFLVTFRSDFTPSIRIRFILLLSDRLELALPGWGTNRIVDPLIFNTRQVNALEDLFEMDARVNQDDILIIEAKGFLSYRLQVFIKIGSIIRVDKLVIFLL